MVYLWRATPGLSEAAALSYERGELSGLVDLLQKVAINEVVASSFTELTGATSVGAWLASMG